MVNGVAYLNSRRANIGRNHIVFLANENNFQNIYKSQRQKCRDYYWRHFLLENVNTMPDVTSYDVLYAKTLMTFLMPRQVAVEP